MAQFEVQFAHDVLISLAEAAYLPLVSPDALPPGYEVVGPLRVNQIRAERVMAEATASMASAAQARMLAQMRKDGDGFGWVVRNERESILAVSFRGTVSVADWLHDFDWLPESYKFVDGYGTVHKGFQAVYEVVRESMLELVRGEKFARLIVVGHSLGAALSELAAPDLLHNGGVVPEVQNFAGPRAGHHDFSAAFNRDVPICFRVVNAWDIVPHLPPPLALCEHVGEAVRINGGFTLDELTAHSLAKSYGPGLAKLLPQAKFATGAMSGSMEELLVGVEE